MLLSLLIYGNIGVKGVMGMDKKQEYKPIYSDLVDDSQVSCASEKTKTGVSYLPSEKEQEMQNESARQEIRAERIGIIVFTAVADFSGPYHSIHRNRLAFYGICIGRNYYMRNISFCNTWAAYA